MELSVQNEKVKIFVIGMNKTATRSLHKFFLKNNIPSVHWDDGRLAKRIQLNLDLGMPPLEGYDQYTVFSDMEYVGRHPGEFIEAYKYFQTFEASYPDARFILNIRSIDAWIKSRLSHSGGLYADLYRLQLGNISERDLVWRWRKDYFRHYFEVLDYFELKREKLIIFSIDSDPIDKIIDALRDVFHLDRKWYGHSGVGRYV